MFAQGTDSLSNRSSDSTASNSMSEINDIVYSEAKDSLIFDLSSRNLNAYGDSKLRYKSTSLESYQIKMDFVNNELDASGYLDSNNQYVETPVLVDNGEVYKGKRIRYNFKTHRGLITMAESKKDNTIYRGEDNLKSFGDVFFYLKMGDFTTCDYNSSP